MSHNIAKLVCFGAGGDVVEYGGGCRGTGYGTPERPHAADPASHTIPDGTIAIDKRPALNTTEGLSWVYRGPLVDVDLPDGECDPCPVPSDLFASAVSGNPFGELLDLQAAHKESGRKEPGPLDSVSISEYVAGWRAVGARIGKYVDNQIVWES